jgi:hypothetical protein
MVMLARSFITRAGAVAAITATLAATAVPNPAYARHGNGAGIALGIIGGMLAGAAIASSQSGYAASPAYYYQPPQAYEAPQAYYGQPAYYEPAPYGYASYGDYR